MNGLRVFLIGSCAVAGGLVIWGISGGIQASAVAEDDEERERAEREAAEREAAERGERAAEEREGDEAERREHAEEHGREKAAGEREHVLERHIEELIAVRKQLRREMLEVRERLDASSSEEQRREWEAKLRALRAKGEQVERKLHALERKLGDEPRERQRGARYRNRLQAELDEIERAVEEHREAGNVEKAERLARRAREVAEHLERLRRENGEHRRPPHGPHDLERRMRHVRAAVENLRTAGLHDHAEELMKVAERMQDEFRERQERRRKHHERGGHAVGELHGEIRQLRHELSELQRVVEELVEHERREDD